jgi:hypothetical protein
MCFLIPRLLLVFAIVGLLFGLTALPAQADGPIDQWIAVGQGTNSIAYSADGINWTGLGTGTFSTYGLGVASAPAPELTPPIGGVPGSTPYASQVYTHTLSSGYEFSISLEADIGQIVSSGVLIFVTLVLVVLVIVRILK